MIRGFPSPARRDHRAPAPVRFRGLGADRDQTARGASTRYPFVTLEWAQKWPREKIGKAHKANRAPRPTSPPRRPKSHAPRSAFPARQEPGRLQSCPHYGTAHLNNDLSRPLAPRDRWLTPDLEQCDRRRTRLPGQKLKPSPTPRVAFSLARKAGTRAVSRQPAAQANASLSSGRCHSTDVPKRPRVRYAAELGRRGRGEGTPPPHLTLTLTLQPVSSAPRPLSLAESPHHPNPCNCSPGRKASSTADLKPRGA